MKIDSYEKRYSPFSYTTIRNEFLSFRNLGAIVYCTNGGFNSFRLLIKGSMYYDYVVMVPANLTGNSLAVKIMKYENNARPSNTSGRCS